MRLLSTLRTLPLLCLLGCGAGPAAHANGAHEGSQQAAAPGAPSAGAAGQAAASRGKRIPPPGPGCRQPTVREIPAPRRVTPVGARLGIETQLLSAGGRLVVFQYPQGEPVRGEMFDPARNQWIEVSHKGAPQFGSIDRGPGPIGSPRFFAFEDWVVVTWFDGNQHKRWSGAVFDAHQNSWREMTAAGTPDKLSNALDFGAAGIWLRLDQSFNGGQRYDIRNNRWSPMAAAGAPQARASAMTALVGHHLIVWGGTQLKPFDDGAIYDLRADRWSAMSSAHAPSPRFASFDAATADGMVLWSGNAERGRPPHLTDGGIYARATDRWTPIPSAGAPDPVIGGLFDQDLAWTGEALMVRAFPGESRSDARHLAFFDPTVGRWWQSKAASHMRPLVLAHGRVLLLDPQAPTLFHARQQLECPIPMPSARVFAGIGETSTFALTARIGDELLVWGRTDSHSLTSPCPAGAPCQPAMAASTSIPHGAVMTP